MKNQKKNSKSVIIFLLVLTFIVGTMCSCASSQEDNTDPTKPAESSVNSTEENTDNKSQNKTEIETTADGQTTDEDLEDYVILNNGVRLQLSDDKKSYIVIGMGEQSRPVDAPEQDEDLSLEIPDIYNKIPITAIDNQAFRNTKNLRNIKLSVNTVSIGDSAFAGCENLKEIVLPDNLLEIGSCAFEKCKSLSTVKIPENVTTINSGLFNNCTGLTNLSISNSIKHIGGNVFDGCDQLKYTDDNNGKYLGNEVNPYLVFVRMIDSNAESVTINSGTKIVYGKAMFDSTSLKSIVIPEGVVEIGYKVIKSSKKLETISIPNSIERIDDCAFGDIPFGDQSGDGELIKYNIEQGLKYLGNENNPYLILIGPVDPTIASNAAIHQKCEIIFKDAFKNCKDLAEVNAPSSIRIIGVNVFQSCSSLEKLTVSSENPVFHSNGNCIIETASKALIAGCKGSIIPADGSVTSIKESAFYGCKGLETIRIPDSITQIGRKTFQYCTDLKIVEIGNGLMLISAYSFDHCNNLMSVSFGTSVTSIETSAFNDCNPLLLVNYRGTKEQWSEIDIESPGNTLLSVERIQFIKTGD